MIKVFDISTATSLHCICLKLEKPIQRASTLRNMDGWRESFSTLGKTTFAKFQYTGLSEGRNLNDSRRIERTTSVRERVK